MTTNASEFGLVVCRQAQVPRLQRRAAGSATRATTNDCKIGDDWLDDEHVGVAVIYGGAAIASCYVVHVDSPKPLLVASKS
jgi:hypothetical protein